jgi:hypothetical protein
VAVQLLDRGRRLLGRRELDEGEASRAPVVAIGRDRDVDDLSQLREELTQLSDLRVEVQIADEDLGWNGFFLSSRDRAESVARSRARGSAMARPAWAPPDASSPACAAR